MIGYSDIKHFLPIIQPHYALDTQEGQYAAAAYPTAERFDKAAPRKYGFEYSFIDQTLTSARPTDIAMSTGDLAYRMTTTASTCVPDGSYPSAFA
jgi:hypothetical protein